MNTKRIVLAGGSGFLGQVLAGTLASDGWEPVILSRFSNASARHRTVSWDGRSLGAWCRELEGSAVVINLAGRSVDCRYHERNRRQIVGSRIDSTRVLGQAIALCRHPPRTWLNASTATIYRHSLDRAMDELTGEIGATPEAKDKFSIEVAAAWERTLDEAPTPDTRKVALRTAMVLGPASNSVLPTLCRLARWGLGGSMAGGKQYMSWIHQADFCRAVKWLIDHDEISGPVNLASPHPVPNHEFMRIVRETCGVRIGLPASRWMLEAGAFFLRTETELILKSRRVVPGRLLAGGFTFRYPDLRAAIDDLCGRLNA